MAKGGQQQKKDPVMHLVAGMYECWWCARVWFSGSRSSCLPKILGKEGGNRACTAAVGLDLFSVDSNYETSWSSAKTVGRCTSA